MHKIHNMKGGVGLTYVWKDRGIDDALSYFLDNSLFKILTNNSASCITIMALLNVDDVIVSPFVVINSFNFYSNVNCLLFKIFPSNENTSGIGHPAPSVNINNADWSVIQGRGDYNGIEINNYISIDNEVNIQKDIYSKSLISKLSYLDALCPSILYKLNPVPLDISIKIKSYFRYDKIIPRTNKTIEDELIDIFHIFNAKTITNIKSNISIIIMEFMDGYLPAINYIDDKRWSTFFMPIMIYELNRLHSFGYFHGDSHLENMMINPNVSYYSNTENPEYLGALKIIDFGRTNKIADVYMIDYNNPNYDFKILYNEKFFSKEYNQYAYAHTQANIEFIKDIIKQFNMSRDIYINTILHSKLTQFCNIHNISKDFQKPLAFIQMLFPELHIDLVNNRTKHGNKTISHTGGKYNNKPLKIDFNFSGKDNLYNMKPLPIQDKKNMTNMNIDNFKVLFDINKPNKKYPIIEAVLSNKEKKMSVTDFKNIFIDSLMQNDNPETFNINLFLKKELIKNSSTQTNKTNVNKSHTKKNKVII